MLNNKNRSAREIMLNNKNRSAREIMLENISRSAREIMLENINWSAREIMLNNYKPVGTKKYIKKKKASSVIWQRRLFQFQVNF